jgi:hypothetical protein
LVEQGLVGVAVVGGEAGDGGAYVAVGELGRGVDRAGEEPFAEWAEWDEPDSEFGAGW